MSIEKQKISRRDMFKLAGKAGLATVLGHGLQSAPAIAAEAAATALPQVPRRVLGKTGEPIPILLMGGNMAFDERFDPRIAECMRFGVNYFDLADCYIGGRSETGFGSFVGKSGKRTDLWITTKSDDHSPEGLERVLARSLERLQTDHVDLYFLHALKDPRTLNPATARAAEKLKKEGKIKFFGFSCHHGTVAELLTKAAGLSWIDAIMFRYNFREYGNLELNRAMDACHQANVGLIAMKTQGSAVSFEDRVKMFEGGKFNRHQAVLRAVWADERITAAVSHMDNLSKMKENIAAALDRSTLSLREHEELQRYARDTEHLYCAGCDHLCGQALPEGIQVGTTLRYLMYHDSYGDIETARELYGKLPAAAKRIDGVDFAGANKLCPHQLDVAKHMTRAAQVLA